MARFAEELRIARAALGLSKRALARRAGVARSTIDRAEAGALDLAVGTLTAIAAAADLDLVLRTYPRRGRGVRDARHAALVDALRRAAIGSAWRSRVEVAAGEFGRSADLVLFGPSEVLHVEVERRIVDLQGQLRSALHKRDALAATTERPVRLVLVIEDVRRNREALRPHDALLRSQLPATSRQVMQALRSGEPLGKDGLLWRRSRAVP
jgi:transcriptional regulator with XRE-family HTH domain